MSRTPILALLAGLLLLAGTGCHKHRHCVPEPLAKSKDLVDLSLPPDAHAAVNRSVTGEVAAEFRRRGAAEHPPGSRPYHFLALSGGGLYAPFGVGVLTGWTDSGTRPEFDVVTGISTGALMSTFAFLGPQYDGLMATKFVGVDQGQILRRRPAIRLPCADAVFSSRPLARQIEESVTPQVLCEVARAHAAGRRLYVGTTNIDTRGLVIWDMGAIASRGTPEARDLYCKVVLASSSIPGAFPPVRLPVEIDGRQYDELHVDGGVSDEVIFRSFMVADLNRARGATGHRAPEGSTLHVINNGKLYADPDCVKPKILSLVGASFRSIIYGKSRDELHRIYLICLETGVNFRLTAVPQEMKLSPGSLTVSVDDQRQLFAVGHQKGHGVPDGQGWRQEPPGIDPSEQVMPRAGTRFVTGKPPPAAPGPPVE